MKNILMLHGINHNMFGKRDPAQYGTITLDEIDAQLKSLGKELGAEVQSYQTNGEGDMCERIHQAFTDKVDRRPDDDGPARLPTREERPLYHVHMQIRSGTKPSSLHTGAVQAERRSRSKGP